jgi:DNA-binding XRE family transcriptional regulator
MTTAASRVRPWTALPCSNEGVELLLEAVFGRDTGVDRAAKRFGAPVGHNWSPALAAFSCRSRRSRRSRETRQRLDAERLRAPGPASVEQIDIQADIAGNLALCAEGKSETYIEGVRKAAAREDATEKHVVTPGPIILARELLADLLLASGKAGDALQEYEAVLSKEPIRYRALLGAARAASRTGNESRAREMFKKLELASRIGRTPESVSNIERGRHLPTLETLSDLGKALGVAAAEFLEDAEDRRKV